MTNDNHRTIDVEQRAAQGRDNFLKGYNCCQAVVETFLDLYPEAHRDTVMRMAASMGGGMGRLRLTCGAVTGLALLAGLENGNPVPEGPDSRARNYALVQELAAAFKEENDSLVCAELLGMRSGTIAPPRPSERTAEYYKARPCPKLVECACRIYAQHWNTTHSG